MTSGEKVKALRLRLGLSQGQFGKSIGSSYQTVSRWERGENVPFNKQLAIIKAYNVDQTDILDDNAIKSLNDNQEVVNRIKSDYEKLDVESRKQVIALILGYTK